MLPCVVNYRSHPRRTFQFRHRDEKLVTRRDFCPFFSWACALFHFPYPVTLLFATHTKSAGVYTKSSHFGTPRSSLATLTSTLRPLTSTFSYSFELLCTLQKLNSFGFMRFRTLARKQPGVGVPPPHKREPHEPSGYRSPICQWHPPRLGSTRHQPAPPAPSLTGTLSGSQTTSHFPTGCRPPAQMLRFGVP